MSQARVRKIADRIRVIVAEMLERRIKDPRLGFVTITDVRVTGDTQHATVFYTVFGSDAERAASTAALDSAKGLLRSEVGKQLGMRHTPTLLTQLAVRIEQVNVSGTAVTFPANFLPPPDEPEGSPAEKTYTPKSISFSVIKDLPSYLVASLNLQRIERAPRAVELFSKGPHDATQTFDIGNPNLIIETAKSVEIGLKRPLGSFRFDGKAYYTRYDRFIFQQPTGNFCDEDFASCGIGTGTRPSSASTVVYGSTPLPTMLNAPVAVDSTAFCSAFAASCSCTNCIRGSWPIITGATGRVKKRVYMFDTVGPRIGAKRRMHTSTSRCSCAKRCTCFSARTLSLTNRESRWPRSSASLSSRLPAWSTWHNSPSQTRSVASPISRQAVASMELARWKACVNR